MSNLYNRTDVEKIVQEVVVRRGVPHGHVRAEIPGRGQYQTDTASFDALLAEYGSWDVKRLKAKLQKRSDEQHGGGIDYSDLRSVTECLFIMAELSGLATN